MTEDQYGAIFYLEKKKINLLHRAWLWVGKRNGWYIEHAKRYAVRRIFGGGGSLRVGYEDRGIPVDEIHVPIFESGARIGLPYSGIWGNDQIERGPLGTGFYKLVQAIYEYRGEL